VTAFSIPSAPRSCTRRAWLKQAGMGTAVLCLGARLALLAEEPRVAGRGNVSDEDEIALGRRFAAEFEQEAPVLSNPLIDQHLNAIVAELAAQSQRPGLTYRVKVINSAMVNASSLPGGTIYVYRGMLDLMTSEDELAATLAHEIGHIAGRHAINQLMLTFQARALLKPVLDNLSRQNGVVEKIILQLGGAVAVLARLHFSRQDEAQADLLGLYDVLRAGWDPRGLIKMFAAVDALEKANGGTAIPLLSGHPPTPERLAAIQHELTLVTIPEDARTDSLDFRACKAALQLLPPAPRAAQAPSPE
jgi:beta-barrel assembly-enhancing protease